MDPRSTLAIALLQLLACLAVQACAQSAGSCPEEDASLLSLPAHLRTRAPGEALDPRIAQAVKKEIDATHAAYLAQREAEDLDSLTSVKSLSDADVDLAIKRRQDLSGQAAFSPIPPGCSGADCLSPGMAGNDNGQGLKSFFGESLNGPAAAHLSLSWDVELIYFHAWMLGHFFKLGKYNAVLGPGANVWRNPTCGRSWEYVPGEDPVLGVLLVEAWTLGFNRQSVSPILKHFINNDKETDRMLRRGFEIVPWESQMDLYLKPFVAGSNIGASSTMCGYHWLADPDDSEGKLVSSCFDKRLRWLYEESNRTWVITDFPAAEQVEIYEEPISRSAAGHSWANYASWRTPLDYEKRDAVQQFAQSEGLVEEDNGHQVMANNIESVDRAAKDRFLAGFVGWAKDLGIYKNGQVYAKETDMSGWERETNKEQYYKWVSRTIAESLVLLKNEGSLLPLKAGETITLDRSCTGEAHAALMTAHGSGEMQHHLKETRAETAFAGKTGGAAKVTLVCSLLTGGEGSDRGSINQPRPEIKDKASTCALVIGPGSAAIPWADEVGCILFGLVPSVHTFTGVMYVMYGVVNPSAHLITSIVKVESDLEFSDGDSKRETAYMMLQSGSPPAFEFGWGLPYGVREGWSDIVEVIPTQHDRSLRRIAFCFKAKFSSAPTDHPLPSPTAQFYAQVEGRPWRQLLTFAKFRNLQAKAKECMAVYYDPVAEWEGGNNDGVYVPKTFKLFFGLSGYSSSQEWPSDLEQGEDSTVRFDRRGYPAQVWRRHLANQRETGNSEAEGKVFVQPGRATKDVVLDFWQNLNSPPAATESVVTLGSPGGYYSSRR